MTTDSKYNGWSNYATWRVNLEICDDLASSMIGEQTFPDVESLAEYFKETADDVLTNYGESEDGLAIAYARAFMSDVDWYEIAEANADDLVHSDDDADDDAA